MRLYHCHFCDTFNLLGPPLSKSGGTHEVSFPSHPARGVACASCETLLEYHRLTPHSLREFADLEDDCLPLKPGSQPF